MRRIVVLVASAMAALLLAGGASVVAFGGPVHAAFPGSTGDIAFENAGIEAPGIYRMPADGHAPEKLDALPDASGGNHDPSWSSDGKLIVFATWGFDEDIAVMDADGGGAMNLTAKEGEGPPEEGDEVGDMSPTFYPGKRKIAFVSDRLDAQRSRENDIYALSFDEAKNTTRVTQLTTSAYQERYPAVSPDGKKIAFVREAASGESDIFVMKANVPEGPENRAVNLTRNDGANAASPDWSPDGKRIVFQEALHDPEVFQNGLDDPEIAVMRADGTRKKQLTDNASGDFDPVFSPDGRKIAFVNGSLEQSPDIYRMRADGTDPTNLTRSPEVTEYRPSWQPVP